MARRKDSTEPVCVWTEDPDGPWQTECGHAFEFIEGTPHENQQQFCGYCGRRLAESRNGTIVIKKEASGDFAL